jgi:hypothetical protein
MKKLFTFLTVMFAFVALNAQIFSEDFEAGLPDTWTTIDADGDGNQWYDLVNEGSPDVITGHSGVGLLTSASYSGSALTPDNWVITPQINLTGVSHVSLWVSGQDPAWSGEHYGIYVSTTGTAAANFTLLFEETLPATETERTWYNRQISLAAYSGNVYIAVRHFNCTNMFRLNLDDVTVAAGVGVDEMGLTDVNIYPNPTTDVLYVAADGYSTVSITNMLGQVIRTENINDTQFALNVTDLNAGVYFINLKGERGTTSKKFIKK